MASRRASAFVNSELRLECLDDRKYVANKISRIFQRGFKHELCIDGVCLVRDTEEGRRELIASRTC